MKVHERFGSAKIRWINFIRPVADERAEEIMERLENQLFRDDISNIAAERLIKCAIDIEFLGHNHRWIVKAFRKRGDASRPASGSSDIFHLAVSDPVIDPWPERASMKDRCDEFVQHNRAVIRRIERWLTDLEAQQAQKTVSDKAAPNPICKKS